MGVFFTFEEFAFSFEHNDEFDVEAHVLVGFCGVEGILYEFACVGCVEVDVDIVFDPLLVKVFDWCEASLSVDHGHLLSFLVVKEQVSDAGFFCDTRVVGTESRGDMYNARTVFGGDIVAEDDAEGFGWCCRAMSLVGGVDYGRLDPWDELFVADAFEVGTFALAEDTVCGFFAGFGREDTVDEGLCHNDAAGLRRVGVCGLEEYVVDIGSDAEGCVTWERPGRGCPCDGVGV